MAISSNELSRQIDRALVHAARTWSHRQEDALDYAETAQPLLSTTPVAFRAAGWLNTGLEAVKTLFPDAALAAAVRQASLPLAVASLAMGEFQKAYRSEWSRTDAVMRGDYRAIKNQLKYTIGKAANDVPNSPFGVRSREVLAEVLRHRLDEFTDEQMAYSHCINMIEHPEHGVVEVRPGQIEERTSTGYGALCRRVYEVYRGSHAPGFKVLWRFKPTTLEACPQRSLLITRHHIKGYDPIVGGEAGNGCWTLAGRGNIKDRRQIAWILGNIWALDVHHEQGMLGRGTTWVWPASREKASLAENLATSYARRGIEEFRASLHAADRAEWPRTQQVRRGAA